MISQSLVNLTTKSDMSLLGLVKSGLSLVGSYLWHTSIPAGHMDAIITTLISYITFKFMASISFTRSDVVKLLAVIYLITNWNLNILAVGAVLCFTAVKYLTVYTTHYTPIVDVMMLVYFYNAKILNGYILLATFLLNYLAMYTSKYAYKHQDHSKLTNMIWLKIPITSLIEWLVNGRTIKLVELVLIGIYYM